MSKKTNTVLSRHPQSLECKSTSHKNNTYKFECRNLTLDYFSKKVNFIICCLNMVKGVMVGGWGQLTGIEKSLTKESRWGHCAVATGNHHTDARLHKGHREVDDLGAFFVYGERSNRHVRPLIEHLRQAEMRRKSGDDSRLPCIYGDWGHQVSRGYPIPKQS